MSSPCPARWISVEEYLSGEPHSELRHEYLDGQVHAMAGAGERHNRIALNAAFHLRTAARGSPCGVFIADMKVHLAHLNRFYYPDVLVTCTAEDADPYVKRRPCLVVEVLSPSTAVTDRREKLPAYLGLPDLRYLLLVGSEERRVDYWLRSAAGTWETARLEDGETLAVTCGPLRASLTLDGLYEDLAWA